MAGQFKYERGGALRCWQKQEEEEGGETTVNHDKVGEMNQ